MIRRCVYKEILKTKFMKASRRDELARQAFDCGALKMEVRVSHNYMGSMLTEDNEMEAETRERTAAGTLCVWSINSLFSSRQASYKRQN